ncbi:poly(glycerol-phosphate) alpha-glucosyltransferase [Prosthecobacter fusiformis]|uniref:Poly(Glycerol-phosphate) alpha-glucosyltransferase n=1 Tax=Prosthecobacter fusiformis TaxID=48464 RepID=A0A4R7RKG9_9BACT|nr:glycosyltransferase [Prosthecobacter fusiformis]TDU64641.1 poly(glycerol-phosphate) alpha-glucosyltransferase [Prosthecobacter fusiformis]
MKVTCLIGSISRKAGGLHTSVRCLMQALKGTGVQVDVLTLEDEHTQTDLSSWLPIEVFSFSAKGPHQWRYSPGIRQHLNLHPPDLISIHGLWSYLSWVSSCWTKRSGCPVIIHPHGMLDPWALANSAWKKRVALALFERTHLRQATCLRALCFSELDAMRGLGLTNPICVIPNAIDLPLLHLSNFSDLVSSSQKKLLFLGRLHPKKGLMNLLRAWSSVKDSQWGQGWVLEIAGWDELGHAEELEQLAIELGLFFSENDESKDSVLSSVRFRGPQFGTGKDLCLRECDAFVLPSFSEGLPMSVLEAWAYGKPVVMTPMCNLPEGFAVGAAIEANPEVASLSNGLLKLMAMTDEELFEMGRRGRQLVESQFTWSEVGSKMKEVYEWMVHGGTVPSCVVV